VLIGGTDLTGAAFCRALQEAGHAVTVWNRTTSKMEPFIARGAHGAESAGAAVRSSPVTLVCLDGYAAARSVLAHQASSLTEKTIIQLSTGTPREAQKKKAWLRGLEAYYLDGAILGSPSTIGTESGLILLSGSEAAFERSRNVLKRLAGDVRYVGPKVGAAATLDLAWLCQRFGLFLGLAHGARRCEAQNVDLTQLASMLSSGVRGRTFLETLAHIPIDVCLADQISGHPKVCALKHANSDKQGTRDQETLPPTQVPTMVGMSGAADQEML
jgi:3-hydroxyisobutyrate dehydrogenase-like beta-hydroxyacid dehydrogenase